MKASYKFFSNRKCRYFPCHKTGDKTHFNCLFCYCPLYFTGDNCGGRFKYTEKGVKDCSDCLLPHIAENYDYIRSRIDDIIDASCENDKTKKDQ